MAGDADPVTFAAIADAAELGVLRGREVLAAGERARRAGKEGADVAYTRMWMPEREALWEVARLLARIEAGWSADEVWRLLREAARQADGVKRPEAADAA